MTRNGKPLHWCAHCGRWTSTHGTAGHTNRATLRPNVGMSAANVCTLATTPISGMVLDPSAWHARVERIPASTSWWTILCFAFLTFMTGWFAGSVDLAAFILSIWTQCTSWVHSYQVASIDLSWFSSASLNYDTLPPWLTQLPLSYWLIVGWITFLVLLVPLTSLLAGSFTPAPPSPRWLRRGHSFPPTRRRSQLGQWKPSVRFPKRDPFAHLGSFASYRSRQPRGSLMALLWDASLALLNTSLGLASSLLRFGHRCLKGGGYICL